VPQLETPRTTPRWSRTILPAVLAILGRLLGGIGVDGGSDAWVGGWVELLFHFGEAARPDLQSLATRK
jgi:hypothetical protein